MSFISPLILISGAFLVLFVIFLNIFLRKPRKSINGKHVMITGGSSGIGLSVAKLCLLQGANVTILARDEAKLKSAKEILLELKDSNIGHAIGKIQTLSVDVSGPRSSLTEVVRDSENAFGPVYMLVNNAGFAKAAKFEDISENSARSMMDVNYMGSFFLTQDVVKSMKKADQGGIIVFVSSQGGLLGIFGFTAYAASKGSLVKFAEALHMELKPYDISVTVSYPPDTDTPGFVEENKSKPVETSLISESAGLFKPDEVAQALIEDALVGRFSTSVGLEGFMLTTLSGGMGPITDLRSFLAQIWLAGIFRFISLFYLWSFDRIVANERTKRLKSKKAE